MNIWLVYEKTQDNDKIGHSVIRFKEEIEKRGHRPIFIDANKLIISNLNGQYRFENYTAIEDQRDIPMPDLVISRTGAITRQSSFSLYKLLEGMGVPVVNSGASIALAMDKFDTAVRLKSAGIPCPDFMLASPRVPIQTIVDALGLPVVAKLPSGSFGNEVALLSTKQELQDYMIGHMASETLHSTGLKFQRYIVNSHGRDYRLVVAGDQVVASMERRSATDDFRANATRGGEAFPLIPSAEMVDIAVRSSRLLGLEIAGVDILDGGTEGPTICEVNSAPGAEKLEPTTGINVIGALVDHAISVAHARQRPFIQAEPEQQRLIV